MNISGLIRLVSILLTAIVVISFGMFVWDELGSASKNQTQLASASGERVLSVRDLHGRLAVTENTTLRVDLDRANDMITGPGESIGRKFGNSEAWAMRGAAFFFGLLVFLVGLRLLAGYIEMSGPASGSVAPRNPQDGFTAGSR
jgi:predicted small integral membrane protein